MDGQLEQRRAEVPKLSRAKPRPGSPKCGPELSATRPRSRKAAAGSSPSPSGAAVEPGQVAGLRREVAHLWQVLGEQLPERAPVSVEVAQERVEPLRRRARTRRPTRGRRGGRRERRGARAGDPSAGPAIRSEEATISAHFSPAMFQVFEAPS